MSSAYPLPNFCSHLLCVPRRVDEGCPVIYGEQKVGPWIIELFCCAALSLLLSLLSNYGHILTKYTCSQCEKSCLSGRREFICWSSTWAWNVRLCITLIQISNGIILSKFWPEKIDQRSDSLHLFCGRATTKKVINKISNEFQFRSRFNNRNREFSVQLIRILSYSRLISRNRYLDDFIRIANISADFNLVFRIIFGSIEASDKCHKKIRRPLLNLNVKQSVTKVPRVHRLKSRVDWIGVLCLGEKCFCLMKNVTELHNWVREGPDKNLY